MLTPAAIQAALDAKVKPPGSLGRLESLAAQIASATGSLKPEIRSCALVLFAGDHGVAAEGVSAYPQSVTRDMCRTFAAGGAASTVFAQCLGVDVTVVNCGVAGAPIERPGVIDAPIAAGTRNFVVEPAMSAHQYGAAFALGESQVAASKADVLAFGEMGIANTSAAAIIAHKAIGAPLSSLVGRGAGLNDAGLLRKQAILERAALRTSPRLSPREALIEYGGFEIAAMTGAMCAAAQSGRMVLVDGFIATSAAVCAAIMAPEIDPFLIFAHRSAERGHDVMLNHLRRRALLDMDMRLGEGVGAVLAWPLVLCAAAMLREMASFEDAGVSEAL